MTSREVLAGEPSNAAAPAEATGSERVRQLQAVRMQEAERREDLRLLLRKECDREKRLAVSDQQQGDRIVARVKRLARQDSPPTAKQIRNLAQELVRARELQADLAGARARVQGLEEACERAEGFEQVLGREQALAMAQARSWARAEALARAQARSTRLRVIASARVLWLVMPAPSGLWHGIVRSLYLGMRVIALAIWILPRAERARWKQESYTALEELKREGEPLLGTAIRTTLRIPWLALVLWTPSTRRRLTRLKPLWIGLGTAAATLLAGFAGIGQSPTDGQVRSLIAGSLLFGTLAASQAYKGRRPRRRRRKRR